VILLKGVSEFIQKVLSIKLFGLGCLFPHYTMKGFDLQELFKEKHIDNMENKL